MQVVPELDRAIKMAFSCLRNFGDVIPQKTWQSIKSPKDTFEVTNSFLKASMPETIGKLATLTGADLPWAEDHFQERINGEPLNPGKQWKNWRHYRKGDDDKEFKTNGFFSHTYMERFWCKVIRKKNDEKGTTWTENRKGIRSNFGDWEDIVKRAIHDPSSRQLYLSVWHPEDQSNDLANGSVNRRLPCTLGYHFLIRNKRIDLTYHIRSCDIHRHFRNDVYMAIRLAQELRDRMNREYSTHVNAPPDLFSLGQFNMWIGSLHCFVNEIGLLDKNI